MAANPVTRIRVSGTTNSILVTYYYATGGNAVKEYRLNDHRAISGDVNSACNGKVPRGLGQAIARASRGARTHNLFDIR